MLELKINGKELTFQEDISLQELIVFLKKDPAVLVAELNGAIIKQRDWPNTQLVQGDIIELISFVGGG